MWAQELHWADSEIVDRAPVIFARTVDQRSIRYVAEHNASESGGLGSVSNRKTRINTIVIRPKQGTRCVISR